MFSSRKVPSVAGLFRVAAGISHRRVFRGRQIFRVWILASGVLALALGVGAMAAKLVSNEIHPNNQSSQPLIPATSYSHYVTPVWAGLADVSSTPVSTVSAAGFEPVPVAPDSIVAAFGTQLATSTVIATDADPNTPGTQLPTDLGGTTVEVNGRKAGLFFVSPNQVNYVIPSATESGIANVVIKVGTTISNGTVMIAQAAPAIFTANSNGRGVPAASILRVKVDGTQRFEALSQFSQEAGRFVTKPIDMGPDTDLVVLVLFLSGIRNAPDPNGDGYVTESIRVLIGGIEVTTLFAGRQPDFIGLDQVNAVIPRSLIGRGNAQVSVIATGFTASNVVDIEIAGNGGPQPPSIGGFGSASALAGTELIINGQGFSPVKEENIVRINGLDVPDVMEASSTQLKVMVPFNVESGTVSVRTPQGEGQSQSILPVRTSISGFVENTNGQPLADMTVRIKDLSGDPTKDIVTKTTTNGSFVLPDVKAQAHFVEFVGSSLLTSPPYPELSMKITAQANRDNQFSRHIALQQETGGSATIGGGSFGQEGGEDGATAEQQKPDKASQQQVTIQTGDYQLVVEPGTKVSGPNGQNSATFVLTPLRNARTPVELPLGYYSTSIVQITPFNYVLEPGAKLIFPNTDGFQAGSRLTLFRFDRDAGRFVEEKARVMVSSDGRRIETDSDTIKVTSYYFASIYLSTTTVSGRVLDNNRKPVAKALVRCKGQEGFTDGNGSYVLRYVPVKEGEVITVDAGVLRASQNVVRPPSVSAVAVVGGITKMPDLLLPDETANRPPTIIAVDKIEMAEGKVLDVGVKIFDTDRDQTVTTGVSGADFATLTKREVGSSPNHYTLRLAPNFTQSGQYTVVITATDNLGLSARENIAVIVENVNRPPVGMAKTITIDEDATGSISLEATDPDNDRMVYKVALQPANGALSGTPPELSYKPSLNFNGTDQFTFVANDGKLDSDVAMVAITVRPVNDPPVLTVPGAQTVNEGQQLAFAVSAADPDTGDTITVSSGSLPEGATFAPATAGGAMQFRWTPNFNQAGTYTISFNATDNATPPASDTKEVRITVSDVSLLTVPGAQSVNEGRLLTFNVSASQGATSPVTIMAIDVPSGASINSLSVNNAQFNWTPGIAQAGNYIVMFRATINSPVPITETKQVQITVVDVVRDLEKEGAQFSVWGDAPTQANATADSGDALGASLATGDLNGDGVADLVVGAPTANGTGTDAGKVYVFFGKAGLSGQVDLAQQRADVEILGEAAGDHCGASLAIGDVNGDGKNDLIIGAPLANLGDLPDAGKVYVIFGGFTAGTAETINKLAGTTVFGSQRSLHLGASLATGQLITKNAPAADIIVGAPGFDATVAAAQLNDVGAVMVFFGGPALAQTIDLANAAPGFAVMGTLAGGEIGTRLAAGNFNGDELTDFAIGAPLANANGIKGSGIVYLVLGGPDNTGVKNTSQASSLILFGTGEGDNLGSSLAMGDLNGDSQSDLLIGAVGADVAGSTTRQNVGAVFLIYGGTNLQGRPADLTVIGAGASADQHPDALGTTLTVGDFNGDGLADVAIGAPGADITDHQRDPLGAVYVIYGARTGLTGVYDLSTKLADWMAWGADPGDSLGTGAIAITNLNATDPGDIILGLPKGRSINNSRIDAGEVRAVYGAKR